MKKIKGNKMMAYILCTGLLVSTFGMNFVTYNGDHLKSKASEFIKLAGNSSKIDLNKERISKENLVHKNGNTQKIYEKTQVSLKNAVNSQKVDKYNLKREDIEELIKKGFTMEEIFEADDIANKINVEPKVLLDRKVKEGKSLKEIKSIIFEEKVVHKINELKKNNALEFEELSKKQMDKTELLNRLTYINNIKKNSNEKNVSEIREDINLFLKDDISKKYDMAPEEVYMVKKISKSKNQPFEQELKKFKEQKLTLIKGEKK